MPSPAYNFSVDSRGLVYTFLSVGTRNLIKKVIFTELEPLFFNVELRTEDSGILLPDTENSNNGDIFSVLKTCALVVQHFLLNHDGVAVYIRGSDERRQNRYQRMLMDAINSDKSLHVFGELPDGTAERLQKHITYVACLVFRN